MSTSYRLPLPEPRKPPEDPSTHKATPSKVSSGPVPWFRSIKYQHLLAGVSGGVVSTLLLHPLDLLKIRFAVDDGKNVYKPKYNGLRNAVASIFRTEGLRGLYRGVMPNTVGAGSAWGFYFLFYQTIKADMQSHDSQTQLSPTYHMLAASEAGILTLVLTNPIGVVKTRICLQYESAAAVKAAADSKVMYKGMVDAFVKICKYEGIRGLYKGFVPGMFGVSHGAVQFVAYEELKSSYNLYRQQPIDTKLDSSQYLLFAAVSKFFAAITTYPYQVVRARLQETHCRYDGVIDCCVKTFKYEGLVGFYKGMAPYLVHVMPNICLVFLIYEKVANR